MITFCKVKLQLGFPQKDDFVKSDSLNAEADMVPNVDSKLQDLRFEKFKMD